MRNIKWVWRSAAVWTELVRYHADGPEGQQVVVLLAVAPGVPAGVLALLQDEHLPTEVYLLEAYKAEEERRPFKGAMQGFTASSQRTRMSKGNCAINTAKLIGSSGDAANQTALLHQWAQSSQGPS